MGGLRCSFFSNKVPKETIQAPAQGAAGPLLGVLMQLVALHHERCVSRIAAVLRRLIAVWRL